MHKWRRAEPQWESGKGRGSILVERQHLALCNCGMFSFRYGFECLCVCHAPLAFPCTPQHLHCFVCGGGENFLDIRLSFLANFLHQVHLYKYYLYLCFFFFLLFCFLIFSVLQCILSGKYFTLSFFVYI